MKKLFFLYLLISFIQNAFGQLAVSLAVNPQPTAVLSEWYTDKSVITYIVANQGAPGVTAIIKTQLKNSDGTIVATTDLSKATVHTIERGNRIFNAADVFPLDVMMLSNEARTIVQRAGKLPSGSYQLTVQLVRPATYDAMSEERTRSFFLAAIQLPILMLPYHNQVLKEEEATTAITFRWTPVVPTQQTLPSYHLQVFEILAGQQPLQGLRSNQPLLDITVRGQTQYIWRPQISFKEDSVGKRFIWTIQTLDVAGAPLVKTDGNGESRSEPFEFTVVSRATLLKKKTND